MLSLYLAIHGLASAVPSRYLSSYVVLACIPGQMNSVTNSSLTSETTIYIERNFVYEVIVFLIIMSVYVARLIY
jgi:hypothetical protein